MMTPEVVFIVVTPTENAIAEAAPLTSRLEARPTHLPATAHTPMLDPQFAAVAGVVVGTGLLLVLPMCLVLVAALAYWIGRRL
jgi:hypothetical protein